MFPEGVSIDALTGAVTPSTGEYTKRLSEFRSVYRDGKALDDLMAAECKIAPNNDPLWKTI